MKKYETEVKAAISSALPMVLRDGMWVPSKVDDKIAIPEGAPHDYPVPYPSFAKIKDERPYQIPVRTPREVKAVTDTFVELTGIDPGEEWVDAVVAHEAEHLEAVQEYLGGAAVLTVVVLANWEADQLGWTLSTTSCDYTTTKIGHTYVRMYPREPSPADYGDAHNLGYANAQEVSTVAQRFGLPPLPHA